MRSDADWVRPVGRFAPSPTGPLHLGHAFAFLHAWWTTRSRGGRMVLRMEDLDPERCTPKFEQDILFDLEWLGLDWDGPILRQSEQFPRYRDVLEGLRQQGLTYGCRCTRRNIRMMSAPHPGEDLRYPGTCRELGLGVEEGGQVHGQRIKVEPGHVLIEDRVQAPLGTDIAQDLGDFLLWSRSDIPSYQFAVTLDDQYQGVTEVVRGRDLLSSTARQDLLRQHLGYPPINSVHFGMVLDKQGKRLSKRSGSSSIAGFREAGGQAAELVRWVAAVAGLADEGPKPMDYLGSYELPPKEDWWPSEASPGPFPPL